MLLGDLFDDRYPDGIEDIDIKGIAYDSRSVDAGYIFVCIDGFITDGHLFAKTAVEKGASIIVAEKEIDVDVPVIYVENSRKTIAELSSRFYDNPSSKFSLVGITGTNGKTTITYLIKSILETAGKRVGVIGTNQNIIGDKVLVTQSTTPTTPNSLELQQLFSEMVNADAEYVVMEVSSHALELDRVHGCQFDVGVFTNLTQDHLDFHKTMDNYLDAKGKLFEMCKRGVVNIDDDGGRVIANRKSCDMLTLGMKLGSDLVAKNINITARGTDFTLGYCGDEYHVHIAIPGKFSVYNAMCAIGAALSLDIDMATISAGLENASGVVGRVEVVPTNTPYTVIIDYAHTPDGLENIIETVKEFAGGRVVTLFGCGGDRDAAKRSIMGEIAGRLSDYSIITSDNPRTEEPNKIIEEIEVGMKKTSGEYIVIENRRDAIRYALDIAKKDDVIILAGKGQETYQIIGKEKFDFDERVIIYKHLNR